ncbi:MAG: N-acetyl-gamma-glutamyl-phosphate reductase [Firmicutes bacterium]|nr:N-acetyl-gamma-glutamyl-phosphate reductase [Bacillota bacterium]
MTVSIAGGSGYAGGEVLRILLGHPRVDVKQVTSERLAGKYVTSAHPNLRKRCGLQFCSINDLQPCDLIIMALPHGEGLKHIERLMTLAAGLIDLSADFRLKDPSVYPRWYGFEHPLPDYLKRFVYGVPELHREEIRGATLVCGAGCFATATILALRPIFKHGLARDDAAIVDGKLASSGGGREPGITSHHPERSGGIRPHEPTMHRHTAEVVQEAGVNRVHLTTTSVDAVRGILVTCHVFVRDGVTEKDVWRAYRQEYGEEPFVRIVKERHGPYRYPDPRILAGSNFCDIGFELDPGSNRLVIMSAIDNLVKGAAGNGVQAMNLMFGFDETEGLGFPGLHP